MANKWTTEYPTQPGLYWICDYRYKHPTGSVLIPGATVVELDADLDASFIGQDEMRKPADILSAEWLGPIQPPTEENRQLTELFHNRLTNRGKQVLADEAIDNLESQ